MLLAVPVLMPLLMPLLLPAQWESLKVSRGMPVEKGKWVLVV
jgi:hypothetical protein